MTQTKISKFKILLHLVEHYELKVIYLILLSAVVGVLEGINIAAVYPIFTTAFDTGDTQTGIIFSFIDFLAQLLPANDEFINYCLVFIFVALLTFISKIIFVRFKVGLSTRIVQEKQNQIFLKYASADLQHILNSKQGELIYNVNNAPGLISTFLKSLTNTTQTLVMVISVFAVLISVSWIGTLIVTAIGVVYIMISQSIGRKISYRNATIERETLKQSNIILNEFINCFKIIKVSVVDKFWTKLFQANMGQHWDNFRKRSVWLEIPNISLIFVLYAVVGTVALLGKIALGDGFTDFIPVFGTFAFAIFRLFPMIGKIGGELMQIMTSLPYCELVYTVLNTPMTSITNGTQQLDTFRAAVHYENVSFSYDGQTPIINDVSVELKKGENIAIVGRSGSGKTTMVNLLLRLFDITGGNIKIDGLDIKEYDIASWLKKVGYVSQDAYILNDTIENNITFRSGEYNHNEVVEAAMFAHADEFISLFPEGYNTIVGDNGMKLSGGQRQRIAIARAAIRNPEIFIFDEATNSLDNISEVYVQRAIDNISKEKTVITIAHRLSTIVNADKILVMDNGNLVETGNHKELLEKKGYYWNLYNQE